MVERGLVMFNVPALDNNDNNNGDDKKELSKQIHFLLCESCFWCASYLSSKSVSVAKCPNCHDNKIRWMPISNINIYKLAMTPRLHTIEHGDMTAFFKKGFTKELFDYESCLEQRFNFPAIGICAYDSNDIDNNMTLEQIRQLQQYHNQVWMENYQ